MITETEKIQYVLSKTQPTSTRSKTDVCIAFQLTATVAMIAYCNSSALLRWSYCCCWRSV